MGDKRSMRMTASERFDGRWKDLGQMAVVALGLIAEALHRIADALERSDEEQRDG